VLRLGFDAWGMSADLRQTGMGRYTATLLETLPRVAPGIEVFAYGGPAEPRPDWLPGAVRWRSMTGSIHPKLAALDSRLRQLPRLAAADRLDVFHAPAVHVRPSLPPVPKLGCPVVTTVHDVLPLTYYGRSLPLRLRAFYRWNLHRAISSERVLTVSEHSRGEIARSTGIAVGRVAVIPNGVDFPPNPDPAVLQRLGVRPPYLLFAGSYEPRKNLAGALECYREVLRGGPPHQLVAIVERQSGHARDLHSLLHRLGLEDRVQLLSNVSDTDLRALYTQAEVVLFPSLAEGFGFPPVQAAACGVPVIASDLPVLREVMGDAAEFVDPYDPRAMARAVLDLVGNAHRRGQLVAKGALRARLFGVDACVRRHVEVYEQLSISKQRPAAVRLT
jgi:glycosyltransferase involved in cell wall biosynthesis